MKKVSVNRAIMKRLAALNMRDIAKRTAQQWPPILGVDEWSALAIPMQTTLVMDTQAEGPVFHTASGY